MTTPTAAELVDHMIDSADQALIYTEGMDQEDFLADRRTQQAVILNLIILGEAVSKLMDRHLDFVATHRAIEWHAMRGMRNRMAHGYYEIDLNTVWETIQTALPALLAQLRAL